MGDAENHLRVAARARTLSATGRWADAAVLWERLAADNPVQGGHWYRLAEARHRSGELAGALEAYRRVLDLGAWVGAEPELPAEVAYQIARCHARLGQSGEALEALERAVALGLRDLAAVRDEPDFSDLHGRERFRELTSWVDIEGLDRTAGWRADLRVFALEVRRRAYRRVRGAVGREFDARLAELDAAVPERTDAHLLAGLMGMLALLDDGHAFVNPPEDAAHLRRTLPLAFFDFAEGLYVTAAAPGHERLLGAQVLAVGGHPTADAVAALDPLISRDNECWPRRMAPVLLRRSALLHALGLVADPGSVPLTVRLDGDAGTEDVTLDTTAAGAVYTAGTPAPAGWLTYPETRPGPLPLYLRNCGVYYWCTHLPAERLVYFQFNGVGDAPEEPLERFVERLFDLVRRTGADRLVIDLRWNGGGNTFLTLPLLHRLIAERRLNRRGALFVVVGRGTFSAAQNLATLLDLHTEAIFVGEPTGSRPNFVGETVPFALPYSRFEVNVSDLYWQTSWPMDHRAWIAPDLYTPPTFAAYQANRDPAMEAILSLGAADAEHLPG